jgi:sterol desaturase/sphingolipid hydroxylase (fatty acid hydroxylase superfamily)
MGLKGTQVMGSIIYTLVSHQASEHQPWEVGSFSYWFDKPRFHTEGRLAAVLIIPSSWGSQLVTNKHYQANFLAPLTGRKRISARGVSHFQSFTLLLFCLFSLLYFYLHRFYQKYKKISSFVTFTFSSLCCSLSTL